MFITKLPAELFQDLFLAYEAKLAKLNVKPLPVEFLIGEKVIESKDALGGLNATKGLETRLKKYEKLVCFGPDIPDFDTFLFDLAYEKISEAYEIYKTAMIEKGAEYVYEHAYYISIAEEIRFFFEEFSEDTLRIDEDTINVLDCSLRSGFFDELMTQAADCNDFDVTNLETTGEEIVKICRALAAKDK